MNDRNNRNILGTLNFGDFHILSDHSPESAGVGDLYVAGKAVIHGDLILNGEKQEATNKLLQSLKQENSLLKQRLEKLESMVNKLWFSPNMPGYEMANRL